MLKFILVDDEKKIREYEKDIINRILFNKEIDYEILEFSSLDDKLKQTIKSSVPSVYIMDIDLNNKINGLEIGKYIRNYNWDSEIIYITSHDNMFEKIYRNVYKVFDFIEKFDSMEERLSFDINKIILKKWDKKKFKYSNNRISFEIYLDDILYLYRDTIERKVAVKTIEGTIYYVNRNIGQMLEELDDRFIQVHRSCIVNKDKVTLYDWKDGKFTLETGEVVNMLSKNFKN